MYNLLLTVHQIIFYLRSIFSCLDELLKSHATKEVSKASFKYLLVILVAFASVLYLIDFCSVYNIRLNFLLSCSKYYVCQECFKYLFPYPCILSYIKWVIFCDLKMCQAFKRFSHILKILY